MIDFNILLILLIMLYTINPFIKKHVASDFTHDEYFIFSNMFLCLFVLLYSLYLINTKCDVKELTQKINTKNSILCAIGAICGLISSFLLMVLIKENDISTIIPMIQPIVIVLTMVLAFCLSNENINKYKIIGTLLIISGLLAINQGKNPKNNIK
jgi:uncharacterized membrane protein